MKSAPLGLASAMARLAAPAAALVAAGCTLAPDYQRPATNEVPHWKTEAPWRVAQPQDGVPKGAWWALYGDQQLDALEDEARAHNPTLEAARAALDGARAQAAVARSALLPTVAVNGGAARDRTSANRPLANYAVPNQSTVQNDFTLGLGVRYEVDLFGANQSAVQAAEASADEARANLENADLVLSAEVASDYFQLRELDAELVVVQGSIEAQRHALDFVSARHDGGDASGLDLAQQQALLDSTTTQIDLLRVQRDQFEHALATLTGKPAPEFALGSQVIAFTVPAFPLAQPSEVLERRPDVASAERAMAAANAQIGVARAAFFPSIPLIANYGRESNMMSSLLHASSLLWSVGVSASETLFDGGRNQGNLDFARAGYRAAQAQYRQTVLTAMQEAEDGLSGLANLDRASHEANASVASAQRVLDLAQTRYSGGVATYLDVINAQSTLLANQRQATQIAGQQMTTSVYLIKALGGRWSDSAGDAVAHN